MCSANRAVMSITDSAVREALRTEVGAEFYTSPQKYILGSDEGLLDGKDKWEAYIGNILAITRDEDGNSPQVGMFSQGSMQPHTEYMRSLAARFSGETSIPISELGVIHDNPASAEAIYAAKESLVCEAEENPARPSLVSQADAITKVISALPWVAESEVALEEFGFNDNQIRRLRDDKRKAEANAMIAAQMQQPQGEGKDATMYEMSSIIKSFRSGKISMKNAITLFERIGIDEQESREILADAKDVEETITQGGDDE